MISVVVMASTLYLESIEPITLYRVRNKKELLINIYKES